MITLTCGASDNIDECPFHPLERVGADDQHQHAEPGGISNVMPVNACTAKKRPAKRFQQAGNRIDQIKREISLGHLRCRVGDGTEEQKELHSYAKDLADVSIA